MDTLKALTLFVAALALGVSGWVVTHIPQPTPTVQPPFGALSNTEFPTNWIGIGGAHTYEQNASLSNASTTCAIQGPAATSTLQAAQIRFDTGSSSALIVEIGVGTLDATTTLVGTTYNIGASKAAFIQASTSPAAGAATVLAPNQWLNFKVGGGGVGSTFSGTCQAEFLSS
jgi:hypothetical protein